MHMWVYVHVCLCMCVCVCTDINECSERVDVCTNSSEGGHCENTKGSYQCLCVRGFTGNGIPRGLKMGTESGTSCSGKRRLRRCLKTSNFLF